MVCCTQQVETKSLARWCNVEQGSIPLCFEGLCVSRAWPFSSSLEKEGCACQPALHAAPAPCDSDLLTPKIPQAPSFAPTMLPPSMPPRLGMAACAALLFYATQTKQAPFVCTHHASARHAAPVRHSRLRCTPVLCNPDYTGTLICTHHASARRTAPVRLSRLRYTPVLCNPDYTGTLICTHHASTQRAAPVRHGCLRCTPFLL
eukprot:1149214-Pelagomonas_calceolata.AAC.9